MTSHPRNHDRDADGHSRAVLTAIGVFKLVKALALVAAGLAALRIVRDGDAAATLIRWLDAARVDPGNRFIHGLLARVTSVSPRKLEGVALGTFVYAGLFATEGIGLLLRKRWAEYFTIVVTGSFIPLEVAELVRRLTAVRVVMLVLNVAVLAYLVARRVRAAAREHRRPAHAG